MARTQLEMTPFVTTKTQRDRPRWAEAPGYVRASRRSVRARSMWAKIGICMALLAAVILFEVFLMTRDEAATEVAAQEGSTGADSEDTLGRLHFVEAGGVTSVFKVSQRWNLPVEASAYEKLEDDMLLRLVGKPGAIVSAPASGEVVDVSTDGEYGAYVRISHGSDLESFYYNLTDISVEEGQPLVAQDTLGRAGADGSVYVRLRRAGTPVDPTEFIDIGGAG